MALINANNLTISLGVNRMAVRAIEDLTSVSISIDNSLLEVTTQPTNGWKEVIDGVSSSELSFEGYFDISQVNEDIYSLFAVNQRVFFIFDIIGRGFEGFGYITSLSFNGGTDDVAAYSGTISVDGEVTERIITALDVLLDADSEPITDANDDFIITNRII